MIDNDARERLAFLQARHGDLDRQLMATAEQMINLVWPLLETRSDCDAALEILAGNPQMCYLIEARKSALDR